MMKLIDLTGQTFGRLTVVRKDDRKDNSTTWFVCQCTCGNIKSVRSSCLRSGFTRSCGCLNKEVASSRAKKHGEFGTRLYNIWAKMIGRCYCKSSRNFNRYGGRGIEVCEDWKDNYISFRNWAMSHGYADNLTIDRIDVNGNYCPENCRWVTQKVQQNNKSNNRMITYNGETKTLAEWSDVTGIKFATLNQRLRNNWPMEKAFTLKPVVGRNQFSSF